jgi:putative phosphoesterase
MTSHNGRLLILSDIHANWPALEAVLAAEPDCGAVAFCGDVVDYGPCPRECLQWLLLHASYHVQGNHDRALAFGADCHCLGAFREYSLATRDWHRALLDKPEKSFLRQLPVLRRFTWDGRHFRLAHATPQGELFEYLDMEHWGEHIQEVWEDFVILGHTHVQGMQTFGKVTVVNPGSVGLARDHRGEACYAVYDGGTIQLKRLAYDVARTVAALRAAPLPSQVIEGLTQVLVSPGRGCQ